MDKTKAIKKKPKHVRDYHSSSEDEEEVQHVHNFKFEEAPKIRGRRQFTLTLVVPSSIIDNA
jgi:hypothetical protein